jgi:hypothetical protein
MAEILKTYPKARTSEADDAFDKAKRENGYTAFKGHDAGGGTIKMPKGMTAEQEAKWRAGLAKGQAAAEGADYDTGFKASPLLKAAGETVVGMSPVGYALDARDIKTHLAAGSLGAALGVGALAAAGPIAKGVKGAGRMARAAFRGGDEATEAAGAVRQARQYRAPPTDKTFTSRYYVDDEVAARNTAGRAAAGERAEDVFDADPRRLREWRQRAIDRARKEGMTPEEAYGSGWERRTRLRGSSSPPGVEARGTTEPIKHRRMQTPQEAAEIEAARNPPVKLGPRGTVINPPETPMAKSIRRQREEIAVGGGSPNTMLQAAEGMTLSRNIVQLHLKEHSADADRFFREMGDRASYDAQDLLLWLGY